MVLRQGENDAKQLGLFFFAEPDAEAMVEKVCGAQAGLPCCSCLCSVLSSRHCARRSGSRTRSWQSRRAC